MICTISTGSVVKLDADEDDARDRLPLLVILAYDDDDDADSCFE